MIFCQSVAATDIARYRNAEHSDDLIRNWLRNRNTLEFVGLWERLDNAEFNSVEFDGIKMQAGLNSFTLTPRQRIERTSAVGITSKAGRYGGTHAHKDIAFEFAAWISVEFKLYLIKEFQRLKAQIEQLVVLSNLESLNSVLIHQGMPAPERLAQLNAIAIVQMRSLLAAPKVKRLTEKGGKR